MTNPSGIAPVDMRVLVKPDPVEEQTKGGIILAETTKEKQKYAGTKATLIAAGPNAFRDWGLDDDGRPAHGVSPGSRVHFAQYSGARLKGLDGEDYVIMNDADLCAVLEGEQ